MLLYKQEASNFYKGSILKLNLLIVSFSMDSRAHQISSKLPFRLKKSSQYVDCIERLIT